MGFYSYICVGCGLNLAFSGVRGEQVILKHIRHGNLQGEIAKGEYNGYGGVFGDTEFCTDKDEIINSRENIINSCYKLPDSGTYSGISGWHEVCHNNAPEEQRFVVSKTDPKQGWCSKGVRKKFT